MELMSGVAISDIAYRGKTINPSPEFWFGGDFPASVWYLGGDTLFSQQGSIEFLMLRPKNGSLSPVVCGQDTQKNLVPRSDLTPNDVMASHEKSVEIVFGEAGEPLVSGYPQNCNRVLVPSEGGAWQMDEIALVAQNRRVFLTWQRIHSGRAYRLDDGRAQDPAYAKWGSLQSLLSAVFAEKELAPIGEYKAAKIDLPTIRAGRAVVKYYGLAQGWGSAYVRERGEVVEARVHWAHVKDKAHRLVCLRPGTELEYDIAPAKIRNPNRPTLFKYELLNVNIAHQDEGRGNEFDTYAGC